MLSKGNDINHLQLIRKMKLNKLVVAHLNINSTRNKFEALIQNVSGEVDLLMILDTKIDETFPKTQFLIKGFRDTFRIDRMFMGEVSYCMLEKIYLLNFYQQSQYRLNAFSLNLICVSESG